MSDAQHFQAAFISVNRLRGRKSAFKVGDWIMDSGAFSEISTHGHYRFPVSEYAEQIRRWKHNGNLLAAVSQDFMCEPWIVEKTGLSVERHQQLTIERYDALLAEATGVYILPVLQGYAPADYVQHIRMYGDRLTQGMWVGVGSVCKRNGDQRAIASVLIAIRDERPDLLLHGFGLKKTALSSDFITSLLYTADQMRDFARQAVALERERCANVCLDYAKRHDKGDDESKAQAWMMLQCAVAIRKEPQ